MLEHLSTYHNEGLFFLRLAIGSIFLVHGLAKLKNPDMIARALGVPRFVGFLHGLVEVGGAALLMLDMFVRPIALVFSFIMLGAIFFKKFKWNVPFWAQQGTGWEFDFILLAANIYLLTM